jgi:spore maturation protein CgeB
MKIFFVSYKHDYTKGWETTKRNYGGDYYLWYMTLLDIAGGRGHEIIPFWMDEVIFEKGREGMNKALCQEIIKQEPDVCLVCNIDRDINTKTLMEIREKSSAVTVYVCGDDSWRFDSVSRYFAPYFSWVLTWCSGAVEKYHKIGCKNVIGSQPWVDVGVYKPVGGEKNIDVSFVGTQSGPRQRIIDALRKTGINIFVRGNGWPEGAVSQEEMVKIISRSKIGLALNPPAFYFSGRSLSRLFLRRAYLGEGGFPYKLDISNFIDNMKEWLQKRIRQIKARTFEVPACLTMEITQHADNLEEYYIPGEEIAFYEDVPDLINKIKYYLAHDRERESIARRGYERTLKEHTAQKRLGELFSKIGRPL